MPKDLVKKRFLKLNLPIWLGLAIPFIVETYRAFKGDLGAAPAETLNKDTGVITISFLIANLYIGALLALLKRKLPFHGFWVSLRRPLGVFTFIYACFHMSFYILNEGGLNLAIETGLDTTYIQLGLVAFLIIAILAITSNNFFVRKLKAKKWKQLHRLVYIALILGCIHFYLIEKTEHLWLWLTLTPLVIMQAIRLVSFTTKAKQ